MAEGSAKVDNNVICRFFATTGCREGEKCAFPHDRSHTVLDSVCRFYLVGKCIYGIGCRYSHVRPSASASTVTKNNKKDCRNVKLGTSANTRSVEPKVAKSSVSTLGDSSQGNSETTMTLSTEPINPDWVHAPEFVPKTRKSYADTLKSEDPLHSTNNRKNEKSAEECLCPYFIVSECPYEDRCKFVHGEICEICGKACLMPFDKEQQQKHIDQCEKELEKDMEISFAIQRSADKTCGICMDVIMEKEGMSDRRFGILEKCNHVFCLTCIRKWRQVKRAESQNAENIMDPGMTRACPECRVPSDFITPSQYWVDNEEEKKKLIADYKEAMRKKPCRYFDQGRGNCPFAGACFYLHAYPDGRIAEMPPPRPRRRRNQNGDIDLMDHIYLWDFLDFRDENIVMNVDWDDLLYELSDSDDSDRSIAGLLD